MYNRNIYKGYCIGIITMERTQEQIKRLWNNLKNKYNGVYLDLKQIDQLNKRGLKIIL